MVLFHLDAISSITVFIEGRGGEPGLYFRHSACVCKTVYCNCYTAYLKLTPGCKCKLKCTSSRMLEFYHPLVSPGKKCSCIIRAILVFLSFKTAKILFKLLVKRLHLSSRMAQSKSWFTWKYVSNAIISLGFDSFFGLVSFGFCQSLEYIQHMS